MMLMKLISIYLIATVVVGLLFAIQIPFIYLISKLKLKINNFSFQILFLIAFFIMYKSNPELISVFNCNYIVSLQAIVLLTLAVIPTVIIVQFEKREKHKFFEWVLLGISMEIPQRLFLQNFLFIILVKSGFSEANILSIIMNAILWVQFIIFQDVIFKQKLNLKSLPKIISSLWFSIFVGSLYFYSGNILMPILAHGLERMLSEILYDRKVKKAKESRDA